ncbi:MAG: matrixin family metalloprotease [Pelagimonas sp.]|nr:matrixin family metalloprotease [Pelagimonas sp.]
MPEFVRDYTALISAYSWSGEPGTPAVVTYSFETEGADYWVRFTDLPQAVVDTFRPLSSSMQQSAREALQAWADVSGLSFVEVPAGQGDLRFSSIDFDRHAPISNFTGFAYYPTRTVNETYAWDGPIGGDIFFDESIRGNIRFGLLLHEIGHALGLEHPFEGDLQLEDAYDNGTYTVMSYNRSFSQTTLGQFDPAAVQHFYGPNAPVYSTTGGLELFDLDAEAFALTQRWGSSASSITGSSLNDRIQAGGGDDSLAGFGGDDLLEGGSGEDALFGGLGNDTLRGGVGNDWIYGGDNIYTIEDTGQDWVDYADLSADLRVYLEGGFWVDTVWAQAVSDQSGADRIAEVEHILSGAGNDTLVGSDLDNQILSGLGDDYITLGAGDDTARAGRGDDSVSGGSGRDEVSGDGGNDTLSGEAGDDLLRGGRDADSLSGGDDNDKLFGQSHGDTLLGGSGADTLKGGGGNDTLQGDAGDDFLKGGTRRDLLIGGEGDDKLAGNSFADTLQGGAGQDILIAGGDADVLQGGTGDDTLRLGEGADVILFASGDGSDLIEDFSQSEGDRIDLSAHAAVSEFADLSDLIGTQDGDAIIDLGGGDLLHLQGVAASALTADDFLF